MNITKESKVVFKLKSTKEVNMSNWQITHTMNTLMTANNKLEILDLVNAYLKNGGEKKQIFIINDSFRFNTNYQRYFADGNLLCATKDNDLEKMVFMGDIIPMEFNKELYYLRRVFSLYKELNSNIYETTKCRLKKGALEIAIVKCFDEGWEEATKELYKLSRQRGKEILNEPTEKAEDALEKLLRKLEDTYKGRIRIYNKNEDYKKDSSFSERFATLSRPIVGIFHSERKAFEILTAEQMYMNGEESDKVLKLKSIIKNSPVVITIVLTGAMLGTMAYLAVRDHQVNLAIEEDKIPANEERVIKNIFGNEDGEFINKEDKLKPVDEDVEKLAKGVFDKLNFTTNNRKINMEIEKQ